MKIKYLGIIAFLIACTNQAQAIQWEKKLDATNPKETVYVFGNNIPEGKFDYTLTIEDKKEHKKETVFVKGSEKELMESLVQKGGSVILALPEMGKLKNPARSLVAPDFKYVKDFQLEEFLEAPHGLENTIKRNDIKKIIFVRYKNIWKIDQLTLSHILLLFKPHISQEGYTVE